MSPPVVDSTKEVDKKSTQRRINKPLIEKRRRARINDCLTQLKSIVLEASDSKSGRPSKLEKADILEMTVDFLKKRTPCLPADQHASVTSTGNQTEYVEGYSKCVAEISNFLEQTRSINETLKKDIVDHIANKLNNSTGPVPNVEKITLNHQTDLKPRKIQIEPLKKSVESSVNEHEAMDLRINNADSSDQKLEGEPSEHFPSEYTNQNISQSHVINQPMPVGLLCGGQVVLLLQLPPSMTPQQFVAQTFTSQNQSQTTVAPPLSAPFSVFQPNQFAHSQSTIRSEIPKVDSVENQYPSGALILPQFNTTHEKTDANNNDGVLFNGLQVLNVEHGIPGRNPTDQLDHWRPW